MRAHWRKVEDGAGSDKTRGAGGGVPRWVVAAMGLLIGIALLFQPSRSLTQNEDHAEYRVKLAFLYNFAQFIEWPPEAFHDPAAPLSICVAGPDPFQGEIEQDLRGRAVGGHPIEIKRLRPHDDPRTCHMVFVRASEEKVTGEILAGLKGSSTLTVGESKGFAGLGGVINLVLDENKLRFEINPDAALQSHLRISSKLLALAKIVRVESSP